MRRRQFLKTSVMAGASALLLRGRAWPYDQSPTGVTKFVVPLPGLGPTGIPVLTPNTTRFPGKDFYEVQVAQYTQQVHPAIPPTTFWGYADATTKNHRYLGGVIVAKRNRPDTCGFSWWRPRIPRRLSEEWPDAPAGYIERL